MDRWMAFFLFNKFICVINGPFQVVHVKRIIIERFKTGKIDAVSTVKTVGWD